MARFRRSYARQLAGLVVVVLLFVARGLGWIGDDSAPLPGRRAERQVVDVQRVVDGDTLLLRGGQRLRLQGIDTPETVLEDHPVEPWGPEATAFTKEFIRTAGGRVELELDGEQLDQHNRWLRFVWHDGRMLNEELVRAGLARARLGYDYSQAKKARLRRAQQDAQRAGIGLWSKE